MPKIQSREKSSSRFCFAKNRFGRRCRHRVQKPLLYCPSHPTLLATRDCSQVIRSYLRKVERTPTRQKKIPVVHRLFKFLVDQKHFVQAQPVFSAVVQRKMVEFYEQGLPEMRDYHRSIFYRPLDISSEISNLVTSSENTNFSATSSE